MQVRLCECGGNMTNHGPNRLRCNQCNSTVHKLSLVEQKERKATMRARLVDECPPCFTHMQWRQWRDYPAKAGFEPGVLDAYCTDCLPEYKAQQLAKGKCIWPCVTFRLDRDGMIEGRRESMRRRNAA